MVARRTLVESVLANQRPSLIVVLVVVPLACWMWVIAMARDMYGPMSGPSAWMMTMAWDAEHLVLLWAMWAAMMAAMMLPTAAPVVLLYAGAVRHRASEKHPAVLIYAIGAGYTIVWALFSIGATAVQRALAEQSVLTMMMEPSSPRVAGTLLVIAGLYQFTPFKQACLSLCRSPISMLMRDWREGPIGALRMGLSHGLYCVGCCWALMLLLFAGGVMNLAAILALTAWVAIEKVAPLGAQSARVGGALLLACGAWMLTR